MIGSAAGWWWGSCVLMMVVMMVMMIPMMGRGHGHSGHSGHGWSDDSERTLADCLAAGRDRHRGVRATPRGIPAH